MSFCLHRAGRGELQQYERPRADPEGMTEQTQPTGRGWYPDPFSKGSQLRMFDGASWTDKIRPLKSGEGAKAPGQSPKEIAGKKTEPAKAGGDMPMFAPPAATQASEEPQEDSASGKQAPEPAGFQTPSAKSAGASPSSSGFAPPAPQTESGWDSATFTERVDAKSVNDERLKAGNATPSSSPPSTAGEDKPDPAAGGWGSPTESSADSDTGQTAPGWGAPTSESLDDEEDEAHAATADFAVAPPQPQNESPEDFDDYDDSTLGKLKRFVTAPMITWASVLAIGVLLVLGPVLTPSPIQTLPADCTPLTDVLDHYQGAEDFSVTEEAQETMAAVISEGSVSEDMAAMLEKAVEDDNVKPVLKFCSPS